MRSALVALVGLAGLAASAGCGDNEPACGHVQVLSVNRNIWGGHIAVDGERAYYSDYDGAGGLHLVFRQPRDGGQELVIAARSSTERFGFGMATDGRSVYWTGENEPLGYTLFATPVLGGTSLPLGAVSGCPAYGVAVDTVNAYAGSIRCNSGAVDEPARVIAVSNTDASSRVIWSSTDADVSDIAARDGVAYVATTAGLLRVSDTATETLDGRSTYHVVVAGDELVYSTEEEILACPLASCIPRTLYTFHTPITQPRAFAIDGADLYIAEPPQMLFSTGGADAVPLVREMGAAITHITARDGHAYWSTLAVPGSLGIPGSFSGAAMRVARPCQ